MAASRAYFSVEPQTLKDAGFELLRAPEGSKFRSGEASNRSYRRPSVASARPKFRTLSPWATRVRNSGRAYPLRVFGRGLPIEAPLQLVSSNEFWSVVLTPFDQGGSESEPPSDGSTSARYTIMANVSNVHLFPRETFKSKKSCLGRRRSRAFLTAREHHRVHHFGRTVHASDTGFNFLGGFFVGAP